MFWFVSGFSKAVLPVLEMVFGIVAFAKEQVENAQIGLKGHFFVKDLNILGVVLCGRFGFKGFVAVVYQVFGLMVIGIGEGELGFYFEELKQDSKQFCIKIYEQIKLFLVVEGFKMMGIKLKKGRIVVGRDERCPVLFLPVLGVAYLRGVYRLLVASTPNDGNGERLNAV